jgi:suppressor of ftsI
MINRPFTSWLAISSLPTMGLADIPMHTSHGHSSATPSPQAQVSAAESGQLSSGQPFRNPPIVKSQHGKLDVRLTSNKVVVPISGKKVGARAYAMSSGDHAFDYSFMPPILWVSPGDNMQVTLLNKLGEPTNLHTHGFFISPIGNQDNIFVNLDNGKTFTYNYQIPSDSSPGSYWFHPHYHPLVEEQVFGGLSGMIYMEGLEALLPAELRNIEQKFLGLKDFQLTKGNTIPSRDIDSNAPTTRTINGQVQPIIKLRPNETQLWHIGNIGADIFYDLVASGLEVTIIAEDGNPFDRPLRAESLYMPPGKRFDVLVKAPEAGTYQLLTKAISTGPTGDNYPQTLMASVLVDGSPVEPIPTPSSLVPFDDLRSARIDKNRVFDLSENTTTNQFFINERQFNENHVDATPKTQTVEEWVLRNYATEIHPIHVHVNDMQVISINGKPWDARSQVDTFPIPYATPDSSGQMIPGEVVVRTRFRQFIGPYVMHCHILAHEDSGMMTVINVTTPGSE